MDKSRRLHGGNYPSMNALALSDIEREGRRLVRDAASREPAKVVALKTGMTERNVRSIRQNEHQPRWINFIALARECPELRSLIARALALEQRDPRTEAALDAMRRYLDSAPEEGDREPQ